MAYTRTIVGAITGLVVATVALAVAFGVHLNDSERAAIVAEASAVLAFAPLIGAVLDHGKAQSESRTSAAIITAQK
jgi:hypothetical protein